jgi:diguanylate cyclase (GGDEF)-like protein
VETATARASQSADRSRDAVMMRRAPVILPITLLLVGVIAIGLPVVLGLPGLGAFGVLFLGTLVAGHYLASDRVDSFRRFHHLLYLVALSAVAYAVFGLGLPPVITVHFPALILLAAAYLLGARAALIWSLPSLVLVAAGVFLPPASERQVSPAIVFVTRAATLLTILGFAVSFRRAHDRQAAELERSATTDSLTGLANRRELDRALDQVLERSRRFERQGALVFVDLDGVKAINDELGHAGGDAFIRKLGRRIAAATRVVDTVARLGGDEFVILLSEFGDPKGGEVFARKLREILRVPCEIDGLAIQPSASIGVALFPQAADRASELLRLADQAMYEAKRAGGDQIRLQDAEGLREVH